MKKKKKALRVSLWKEHRSFFLFIGICLAVVVIGTLLKIVTYKRPCNYQLGEIRPGQYISKNLPCKLK